MIKIDNNNLSVRGNSGQLCTELETVLREVRKSFEETMGPDVAKDLLKTVFETSLVSEEESFKMIREKLNAADPRQNAILKMIDLLFD